MGRDFYAVLEQVLSLLRGRGRITYNALKLQFNLDDAHVVGVMGGGGRHEHLALGETPNIAARLQALAPANSVVISAVTARLVQGVFALEDLGNHTLHEVVEPMAVRRV